MGSPETAETQTEYDENADLALRLLETSTQQEQTLEEIYAASDEATKVENVELDTGSSGMRLLFLSELLIGHKDSDVGFYGEVIRQVASLPEEARPHAVVISGLPQGDFRFLQKRRRTTLVPQLNNMDAQFGAAKQAIDMAREVGVPIVYNMSNDDRQIAEENTIEMFKRTLKLANGQDGVPYYKIDQMRQHPSWNSHVAFQRDVVFPYCLRAGRTLHSMAAMQELHDVPVEEYSMLYAVHQARTNGEQPDPRYLAALDSEALDGDSNLVITDDVDLIMSAESRDYTVAVRHNLNFSNEPMYQSHMHIPVEAIGQESAHGDAVPDALVTQHNQEAVGADMGGTWAISTPGFIDGTRFLHSRASTTTAPGDVSRRLTTTRRRVSRPGATMHELTENGNHLVTIYNGELIEKASSIGRMALAETCDWQVGSITARPDILVKYLDYLRVKAIGKLPTALFFNGDIIHGRNYPDFPSESQATGLMAMDSQVAFNVELLKRTWGDMRADELGMIGRIAITPGNHEFNSSTEKWTGHSFSDYLKHSFERIYARAGFTDEQIDERVKFYDAVRTAKGEVAKAWTAVEHFGDYGVLAQHFLINKGGKGTGGQLPVYQAQSYISGAGSLVENIDVFLAGHWHHPQYAMFGNKLSVVGGSIAGLSGYELTRGYRPVIGGTIIRLGGGEPPQIEFISEKALHNHQVTTGRFTANQLREEGYTDDAGFDAHEHGLRLPRQFPKSALQKAIRDMERDISDRRHSMGELK